jgi:hypothetical protein
MATQRLFYSADRPLLSVQRLAPGRLSRMMLTETLSGPALPAHLRVVSFALPRHKCFHHALRLIAAACFNTRTYPLPDAVGDRHALPIAHERLL